MFIFLIWLILEARAKWGKFSRSFFGRIEGKKNLFFVIFPPLTWVLIFEICHWNLHSMHSTIFSDLYKEVLVINDLYVRGKLQLTSFVNKCIIIHHIMRCLFGKFLTLLFIFKLGTIHILRQHVFELLWTYPSTNININSTENKQILPFFWPHPPTSLLT